MHFKVFATASLPTSNYGLDPLYPAAFLTLRAARRSALCFRVFMSTLDLQNVSNELALSNKRVRSVGGELGSGLRHLT